jgi:hypothetical protein
MAAGCEVGVIKLLAVRRPESRPIRLPFRLRLLHDGITHAVLPETRRVAKANSPASSAWCGE